jgi:hypothetical protein
MSIWDCDVLRFRVLIFRNDKDVTSCVFVGFQCVGYLVDCVVVVGYSKTFYVLV